MPELSEVKKLTKKLPFCSTTLEDFKIPHRVEQRSFIKAQLTNSSQPNEKKNNYLHFHNNCFYQKKKSRKIGQARHLTFKLATEQNLVGGNKAENL